MTVVAGAAAERRAVGAPRQPAGIRTTAVVATALAAALVLALLLGLALTPFLVRNGPTGLDTEVFRWFAARRTPAGTRVMRWTTYLGSGVVVLPLALAVVTVLVLTARRRLAGFVVVTVGGAAVVDRIAKAVVGRDGPLVVTRFGLPHDASFPSGHSVQAAAICVALGVVVASLTRLRRLRVTAWAVLTLVVVAVGVSRVYLGVHWATDVLAGWLVGASCAVAVAVGMRPGGCPRRAP